MGLKRALTKGIITRLLVEMDVVVVVQLIQNVEGLGCHPLASLICSCCVMKAFGSCEIRHIYTQSA